MVWYGMVRGKLPEQSPWMFWGAYGWMSDEEQMSSSSHPCLCNHTSDLEYLQLLPFVHNVSSSFQNSPSKPYQHHPVHQFPSHFLSSETPVSVYRVLQPNQNKICQSIITFLIKKMKTKLKKEEKMVWNSLTLHQQQHALRKLTSQSSNAAEFFFMLTDIITQHC